MADGPALNIIIPLGGVGSRFQKEGYLTRPKPFVRVQGKEMILWVVEHMRVRPDDSLTLVFNPAWMSMDVFMRELLAAAFPNARLVELPGPTRGAAETVLIGLRAQPPDIRRRPTLLADGDCFYATCDVVGDFRAQAARNMGAVFVFHDTQPKPIYSYVKVDSEQNMIITEVREKVKISDWANSGVYCFPSGEQLAEQCAKLIAEQSTQLSQDNVGEYYTSGVIAAMIKQRLASFRACRIPPESFHVIGIPAQVAEFCRSHRPSRPSRICFSLERTLLSPPISSGGSYSPIERNLRYLRALRRQGHSVIVQTLVRDERLAKRLCRDFRIPCDELALGRPAADVYVDARTADSMLGDLDKQVGFYFDAGAAADRDGDTGAPEVVSGGAVTRQNRVPLWFIGAALLVAVAGVLLGWVSPGFVVGLTVGSGGVLVSQKLAV
eukprot:TRINITY_DN61432_c0_g1_i1.p1 TRINITY_DN61432_c0_g1~~TRINITY_DN61432_c0_g1_i1.p1  ORF type:complete len:438 (+),score=147.40 TRINITY_DN61432_c0_g1_i1:83-1396(+)